MNSQDKTAIILGATGLTGSLLLKKLLDDVRYKSIKVFTRRSPGITHAKLEVIQCDLLDLKSQKDQFHADEVYCCIGTTTKKTPDKKLYHKIDYGIPVAAAQLCKANNIPTLLIVSAIGANANSSIFYNRTKGEMQDAVLKEGIQHTYILQPSIITGDRGESRIAEKIGVIVMSLFQPLLVGPWRKYRAINADTIAKAMIFFANNGFSDLLIESDQIQQYGRH